MRPLSTFFLNADSVALAFGPFVFNEKLSGVSIAAVNDALNDATHLSVQAVWSDRPLNSYGDLPSIVSSSYPPLVGNKSFSSGTGPVSSNPNEIIIPIQRESFVIHLNSRCPASGLYLILLISNNGTVGVGTDAVIGLVKGF